jgi:hypothetical protein
VLREEVGVLLGGLPRRGVDDRAALRHARRPERGRETVEQCHPRLLRTIHVAGREMEVRASEPAEHLLARLAFCPEAEALLDLAPDLGRGGRGARQDARRLEALEQRADAQVVGTEVVAPLRDAVRLVDGDESDVAAGEHAHEDVRSKALRRAVDELVLAAQHLAFALVALLAIERRREERRLDAARLQGPHLVLHERDQRRDHERHAVEDGRRQLVRERFAAARRRDDEHATRLRSSPQDCVDGLALPGAKRFEPEAAPERLLDGIEGVRHRAARILIP